MWYYADRAKETSTTTGTGDFTLAGAVSQFQSINSGIGTNKFFNYAIVGQTGTEWEVGIGYLSSSSNLVRSRTIDGSSGANTAVNFSAGTKDVFVTLGAIAQESYRGLAVAAQKGMDWY